MTSFVLPTVQLQNPTPPSAPIVSASPSKPKRAPLEKEAWLKEWTNKFFTENVWPSFKKILEGSKGNTKITILKSAYSKDMIKKRNAQTQPREYYKRWDISGEISCSLFVLTQMEFEKKKLNFTFFYTERKEIPDRVLWSSFLAIPLVSKNATKRSEQVVQALLRSWNQMNFSYITRIRILDVFQVRAAPAAAVAAAASAKSDEPNENESILLIYPSSSVLMYDDTQETPSVPEELGVFPSPQPLKKERLWSKYFDSFLENSQNQSCILLAQNTMLNHFREVKFFTAFPTFSSQAKEAQNKKATIYVATDLQIRFRYIESKLYKRMRIEVLAKDTLVWPLELQAFLKSWEKNPKVLVKWTGINSVLTKFFLPPKDSRKSKWCSVESVPSAKSTNFYDYLIKFAKALSETNMFSFWDSDFLRRDATKKHFLSGVVDEKEPDPLLSLVSSSQSSPSPSSPSLPPPPPPPPSPPPTLTSSLTDPPLSSSSSQLPSPPLSFVQKDSVPLNTFNDFQDWLTEQIKSWLCVAVNQDSDTAEENLWKWWWATIGTHLVEYFLKSLQIQYMALIQSSVPSFGFDAWLPLLSLHDSKVSFDSFSLVARKAFQLRLYGIPLTLLDIFLITRDIIYSREYSTLQIAFLPEIYSYGIHLGISLHKIDKKPQLQESEIARAPSNPELSAIPTAWLIEKMLVLPHFRHISSQISSFNWFTLDWAIRWFQLLATLISCLDELFGPSTIDQSKIDSASIVFEKQNLDQDTDLITALKELREGLSASQPPPSPKQWPSRVEYAANLTENAFALFHEEKKGSLPFFFFKLGPLEARLIDNKLLVWKTDTMNFKAEWAISSNQQMFDNSILASGFLPAIFKLYEKYRTSTTK